MNSDQRNQIALEFYMNSAAVCSSNKIQTGKVDEYQNNWCLLALFHFDISYLWQWIRKHQNASTVPVIIPTGIPLTKAACIAFYLYDQNYWGLIRLLLWVEFWSEFWLELQRECFKNSAPCSNDKNSDRKLKNNKPLIVLSIPSEVWISNKCVNCSSYHFHL